MKCLWILASFCLLLTRLKPDAINFAGEPPIKLFSGIISIRFLLNDEKGPAIIVPFGNFAFFFRWQFPPIQHPSPTTTAPWFCLMLRLFVFNT